MNLLRFKDVATFVVAAMEQVMPETCPVEVYRFPVKTVFSQLTCEVIEDVSWWRRLVLE